MQSRVDDYYAAFTKGVARGRGVPIAQVRDGMGQGRVLGADAAMAQNMVDGVATFDDVVRKMRRDTKGAAKSIGSRLAHAQRALATFGGADRGQGLGVVGGSSAALPTVRRTTTERQVTTATINRRGPM